MLLDNIGYQAINPFSGSLSDSLGGYLTNVTSLDDIKIAKSLKNIEGIIVGKAIYDGDIKLDELTRELD